MADVYARDALARPLRLLAGMLSEIRSGAFLPDASRAARFPGRVNEARLEEDQAELRLGPLMATADGSARAASSGLEIQGLSRLTVTPMTTAATIMSRRPLLQAETAYFVVLARLWMNIPTWKLKTLLVLILGLGFPHPGRPLLSHPPRTPETTNQTYLG